MQSAQQPTGGSRAQRKRLPISVRFKIRASQRQSPGAKQLQVRLFIYGTPCGDFGSGVYVRPADWDQLAQRVEGTAIEAEQANTRLAEIRVQLRDILRDLEVRYREGRGLLPTAELVKAVWNEPTCLAQPLTKIYARYLDYLDSLIGTEDGRAQRTVERGYKGRQYLTEYLQHLGQPNLSIYDVTTAWGKGFHAWLQREEKGKRTMKKDSATKYLTYVRKALDYAIDERLLKDNPLDRFRPKRGKGKPVYFLEPAHWRTLWNLELEGTEAVVLWWARLMCLTGLDYKDAVLYARNRGAYERQVSFGTKLLIARSKPPHILCEIPLLPQVETLFRQYPTGPEELGLAAINNHLKYIEKLICFPNRLSSKICRKTAGVLFLHLGYRIEVVSKILGHVSIRTTEAHYIRITSSLVDQEMEKVYKQQQAQEQARQREAEPLLLPNWRQIWQRAIPSLLDNEN